MGGPKLEDSRQSDPGVVGHLGGSWDFILPEATLVSERGPISSQGFLHFFLCSLPVDRRAFPTSTSDFNSSKVMLRSALGEHGVGTMWIAVEGTTVLGCSWDKWRWVASSPRPGCWSSLPISPAAVPTGEVPSVGCLTARLLWEEAVGVPTPACARQR